MNNKIAWTLIQFSLVLSISGVAARAKVEPVSAADPSLRSSVTGNSDSSTPGITPDGQFVVFVSGASNLTTNDANVFLNVYQRDLRNKTTVLVSAAVSGTSGGNGSSTAPMVSSNGQWVVFQSTASNLVTNDGNSYSDIFLRDLAGGQTILVSVNASGVGANANSEHPLITPDGRLVAFESAATDLTDNDFNNFTDVYVRDLQSGVTRLVSVNTSGVIAGNARSDLASITPDGRFVLFTSAASNLGAITNNGSEILVRDLLNQQTYWVSSNASKYFPPSPSPKPVNFNPAMSADGKYVAFKASFNSMTVVLRHDLTTGATSLISTNPGAHSAGNADFNGPSISDDGQYVVYAAASKLGILNTTNQIYLWDAASASSTLISVGANGTTPGDANSDTPEISADGKIIVFTSVASNLTTNEVNGLYQVFARDRQSGQTWLVSADRVEGLLGGESLGIPALSADGKKIAFESNSPQIVKDDLNSALDVFARDLLTQSTELVSIRDANLASLTPLGASSDSAYGLSADGRYVAFSSQADNLLPNDNNQQEDVFVRDLMTQTTFLVSLNSGGTASANGPSTTPSISANGRFVAFESAANNLVVKDLNGLKDVFVQDLATKNTILASFNVLEGGGGDRDSDSPVITPDGAYVIYRSKASNLTPTPVNTSFFSLYAYSVAHGTNHLVSMTTASLVNNNNLIAISPNSRKLAFYNEGPSVAGLYVHDLSDQSTTLVTNKFVGSAAFNSNGNLLVFAQNVLGSSNMLVLRDLTANANAVLNATGSVSRVAVNANGSRVAYETALGSPNPNQVYLLDIQSGSNILVSASLAGDQGGNGSSRLPVISQDGSQVIFRSQASDLVANDLNDASDVFLWDMKTGKAMALSLNLAGTATGDNLSTTPVLSADDTTVVFESFASDLIPRDYNLDKDVFVVRSTSTPGDADQDGLPDDWEMNYFGSLSRDGKGDYDHDGMSDLAEYLAGTDPANPASALRILQAGVQEGDKFVITWSAKAGKTYKLQYKTDMRVAAWQELEGSVTADGDTATQVDATSDAQGRRLYRVIVVP